MRLEGKIREFFEKFDNIRIKTMFLRWGKLAFFCLLFSNFWVWNDVSQLSFYLSDFFHFFDPFLTLSRLSLVFRTFVDNKSKREFFFHALRYRQPPYLRALP